MIALKNLCKTLNLIISKCMPSTKYTYLSIFARVTDILSTRLLKHLASSFLFELKTVSVFLIIDPLNMRTCSLLVKFQPYSRLLLSTRKKCRRVFQYFGKIATPSKEVFGLKNERFDTGVAWNQIELISF